MVASTQERGRTEPRPDAERLGPGTGDSGGPSPLGALLSTLLSERLVLLLAAVVIALCDALKATVSGNIAVEGLLDEPAHLATGFLVLACLPWRRTSFVVAVLASSVLLDLDHIPQYLGERWLTAGTERPYPHCLLTVLVVGLLALPRTRVRPVALGAAFGFLCHLLRDLSEPHTGVALLWPLSDRPFSLPYSVYAVVMLAVLAAAAWRARAKRTSRWAADPSRPA